MGSNDVFTSSFSSAKHAPPSCLVQLVERRDLLTRIEEQRHKRLLLVQAPAGYGKTVLLAQWREHLLRNGSHVGWIGLEHPDRGAIQFVTTIASALIHAGVDLPDDFLHGAGGGQADDILEALLRHCERHPRETWLMFEDWHLVETDEVAILMDRMLRRMPARWHVALSSRTRPRLNLLALLGQGQLIELGQDDLRFSLPETRQLIGTSTLPSEAADDLSELTEGWAIALQLSKLWLSRDGAIQSLRSSFIVSIDGMADYLAAEVFASLPAETRDFLVESSITPRVSGDLADSVRQRADSTRMMDALKTLHGLTIPLDSGRQWYRHHRIFAEFLDGERRKLSTERLATLHRGAADWFEREGLVLEAIGHARLSGDMHRATALLEGAGCVDICLRLGAPAVRPYLDSVPPEVVQARPRLRIAYAAMHLKRGSIAHAVRILTEMEAEVAPDADPALRRDLLIVGNLRHCFIDEIPSPETLPNHRRLIAALDPDDWWVAGVMYNVQGRLEVRLGYLTEAVDSLSRADALFHRGGSMHGHFFMLANRAICRLFLGQLDAAGRDLEAARNVLSSGLDHSTSYAGVTRTAEAMLLYERGDLAAAAEAAEAALAGLEQAEGCFEQYLLATLVAARTAFTFSGLDAARRSVDRGRRLARYHGMIRVDGLLDRLEARLLVDAGHWDEAARLAGATDISAASGETGWIECDLSMPVLALLSLHDGRCEEAHALALDMLGRCRATGRVPGVVRALTLAAVAAAAGGNHETACDHVYEAVRYAAPQRIFQPFLEFHAQLLPLLQRPEPHTGDLPALDASFVATSTLRMVATAKARGHVERLTGRERDVLAHLRHGKSNKLIARALDLSEDAVKFHMKNVFRKLDIDSRAMAAEVAQRLPVS